MRSSSKLARFVCLPCRLREAAHLPAPTTIYRANLSTRPRLLSQSITPIVELSAAQTNEIQQLNHLRKRLVSGIPTPVPEAPGPIPGLSFDEALRVLPPTSYTDKQLLRRVGDAWAGRELSDVLPDLAAVSQHRRAKASVVKDPRTQKLLRELGVTNHGPGGRSLPAATAAAVETVRVRRVKASSRKRRQENRTANAIKRPAQTNARKTQRRGRGQFRKITVSQAFQSKVIAREISEAYRTKAAEARDARIRATLQKSQRSMMSSTHDIDGKDQLSDSHSSTAWSPMSEDAIAKLEEAKVETLNAQELAMRALDYGNPQVPTLSFDLPRVLFNPGVYQLQDQRSGVYNFDPYLERIMPISEFNFDALNAYTTSSEDTLLSQLARKNHKKYVGSSSSMSGALSQLHFLLSQSRSLNTDNLSNTFRYASKEFTTLTRCPSALFLRHKDGVYAVDADKEFDSANVLMELGKSMEKLLTLPKGKFEKLRRDRPFGELDEAAEKLVEPEAYHYCEQGDFLLRSQLDAYDPRLPGTGMFDLKTRAVVSIRMNVSQHQEGVGYQIRSRYGEYESYEREYYDMIRNAFLKYSLQVRMGRMDGIFVAYHNVERIFGFQYIPLPEMDLALHGQEDRCLGDKEFRLSVQLLNVIFDTATQRFPQTSLRFHFETRPKTTQESTPYLLVFAEPYEEEEIQNIQNSKKEAIAEFKQRMLNPPPTLTMPGAVSKAQEDDTGPEDDLLSRLNAMPDDTPPTSVSSTTINSTSGGDSSTTTTSTGDMPSSSISSSSTSHPASKTRLFFAASIHIRNLVNGLPVPRPTRLSATDDWSVEYTLTEYSPTKGQDLLTACKNRRKAMLHKLVQASESAFTGGDASSGGVNKGFLAKFKRMSEAGAAWRKELDREFERQGGGKKVLYPHLTEEE